MKRPNRFHGWNIYESVCAVHCDILLHYLSLSLLQVGHLPSNQSRLWQYQFSTLAWWGEQQPDIPADLYQAIDDACIWGSSQRITLVQEPKSRKQKQPVNQTKPKQNNSSTLLPSKRSRAFNDFDVSPNKKKSPIKSNKAGGNGRKLEIMSKVLHLYDYILSSSRIITLVTTYHSLIQLSNWPCYLTFYARNFKTINFMP